MTPEQAPTPPTLPLGKRRWFQWFFWGLFFPLFVVALLVGSAYQIENRLGARAWRDYVARAKARGEWFEAKDLLPAPIPDEENFASIPLFKPLFDYTLPPGPGAYPRTPVWNDPAAKKRLDDLTLTGTSNYREVPPIATDWRKGEFLNLVEWQAFFRKRKEPGLAAQPEKPGADVLKALAKFDPELDALRAAAKRPGCRFPVHYEEFSVPLPHLTLLQALDKVLRLRVLAELAQGDSESAMEDLRLQFRLVQALKGEPLMISFLVRVSFLEVALEQIWEGLERHQWNEAQLAVLESLLSEVDLVAGYRDTLRAERFVFGLRMLDAYRENPAMLVDALNCLNGGRPEEWYERAKLLCRWLPSGVYDFNMVAACEIGERQSQAADPGAHRFLPDVAAKNAIYITGFSHTWMGKQCFMVLQSTWTFESILKKGAQTQSTIDLARVAVALERHRLSHGVYPEALGELSPAFLPQIPSDVVSGNPLCYKKDGERGRFLLYSVGWNQTDDGGKMAWKNSFSSHPDWNQGDWVWPRAK
jgi:hypothetical protein